MAAVATTGPTTAAAIGGRITAVATIVGRMAMAAGDRGMAIAGMGITGRTTVAGRIAADMISVGIYADSARRGDAMNRFRGRRFRRQAT